MIERDSRNRLAWGAENQERLYQSRVLVVGSDVLAQMVLSGLAGLGIGKLYFMDNKRVSKKDKDFLCSHNRFIIGQKKVKHIEDTLKEINTNDERQIVGIHSKFVEALVFNYAPEVVIDATNDPRSKKKSSQGLTSPANFPTIFGQWFLEIIIA